VDKGIGGQRSSCAGEASTHLKNLAHHSVSLAACDSLLGRGRSKKKLLCPNLNHSIPKVRIKQFDRGTNNGSKESHPSTNMGNMMLLPKLAKQIEFDPCKHCIVSAPDSHKEEIRRVGEAQEKNF
jgi:hypothetical protein